MIRNLPLLALVLAAAPAAAQARYRPQPDTLYYEALNPYRMYFVVPKGDTVGDPVRSLNVERHLWRESAAGLTAEVRVDDVDGSQPRTTDVLEVSPRGVVTAIRQGKEDYRGRWDFMLRLPEGGDLHPGRVWHDSLSRTGGPGGENAFQTWRELYVERIVDSLGSRIAVVRGRGTVRYRDSYPARNGKQWWIDVRGPMRETFLFDLTHGRLAGREWWMDLRGSAGFPNARGATDTLAAGLLSTDTTRMISAEEARALTEEGAGTPAPRARPRQDGGAESGAQPAPRAAAAGGSRRGGRRVRVSTQPSSG
jgi:hypothetical protein